MFSVRLLLAYRAIIPSIKKKAKYVRPPKSTSERPKRLPNFHPSLHGLKDALVRCSDVREDAEDFVELVLGDAYYAFCGVSEDNVALVVWGWLFVSLVSGEGERTKGPM